MRPARLELAGFTAFRDPVVVDFADAELFALVGSTGAGKSSLIDAMVFSLYGTVPRLDRRAVEPVIATGSNEARVRLDFTVGARAYTAARVVRRTRTGATTREARLESDGQVLAGDADGVTAAVEEVLGLGYEQFTKCVVLPQGEFARFLHDRPRDRQQLLVRLLELEVYDRMRLAAGSRASSAEGRVAVLDEQLAGLAGATEEALAAAEQRMARLLALREEIDAVQPRLDELDQAETAARSASCAARDAAALLEDLAVPDDVADLAARATEAERAAEAADRALTEAATAAQQIETALAVLPPRTELEQLRDTHQRRAALRARRDTGSGVLAATGAAEQVAAEHDAAAAAALARAEEALAGLRRAHAAHDLAAHLRSGEPCPVCDQQVSRPHHREPPADLTDAEEAVAAARSERESAADALREAGQERARAEETFARVTDELGEVEDALDGRPDAEDVAQLLETVTRAEADLAVARERERGARAGARAAAEDAREARERRDGAWGAFDAARDAVAALSPPPADRGDVAGAWAALVAWAGEEAARQWARAEAAGRRTDAVLAARRELTDRLLTRCEECRVEPGTARPRDAVADAYASAGATRDAIRAALDRAQSLRAERDADAEQAQVARTLAQHLAANRFEQWLLDEALTRLATGASTVLRQLSDGRYSLAVDAQRNFAVIDHRNADERRPARTLSGGETFLASLALALTLAEHLAEMATSATPRLESIFLDEGFGSLDAATLDVVAAAIEELGATGRTVGLVTHVRDLAERVPVRYEVRRGPAGSTVQRVVG